MSFPLRHRDLPDDINAITGDILIAGIAVHRTLGSACLEEPYKLCLAEELDYMGRRVEVEVPVALTYRRIYMPVAARLDLLVEGEVIVELKAVEELHERHRLQLATQLRLAQKRVGLLMNFRVPYLRDGVERIVRTL